MMGTRYARIAFRWMGAYATFLAVTQALCISFSFLSITLSQMLAAFVVVVAAMAGVAHFRWLPTFSGTSDPSERRPRSMLTLFAIVCLTSAALVYVCSFIAAFAKPDLSWDGNS